MNGKGEGDGGTSFWGLEQKKRRERQEEGERWGRERMAEKRRVGKRRGRVLVATVEDTPCQF